MEDGTEEEEETAASELLVSLKVRSHYLILPEKRTDRADHNKVGVPLG